MVMRGELQSGWHDSVLARAAIDAVKRWKYKPYHLRDQPVEIQTQITVNFKLP
jgi:protein TonB